MDTLSATSRPSVTRTVLVWVVAAMASLLLVGAVGALWMRARWEQSDRERIEASIHQQVQLGIASESMSLEYALRDLVRDPDVVDALAVHDRDAALRATTPHYLRLRERLSVTHVYLHDLDGVAFLRAHQPDRFGDLIERRTLVTARSTALPSSGLEVGPLGTLTVRAVHPLRRGGRTIGYTEIGTDIDVLAARVAEVVGRPVGVFVHKSVLDRQGWIDGRQARGLPADWDRLPRHVPSVTEPSLMTAFDGGGLPQVPIVDIDGREVALLVVGWDRSAQVAAMWTVVLVCGVAFLGVVVGLLLLVRGRLLVVDHQLLEAARVEAEAREELEGRVAQRTAELIAEMDERQRTLEQLRHAQKLDSLGQLTGGIAHDFNNALTIIGSNLALAQEDIDDEDVRDMLDDARRAIDRSAELTHRMLAFSRRQPLHLQSFDLGERVTQTLDLLRRTLADHIRVAYEPPEQSIHVLADPAQIESCMLNLVLNARDAMPAGGTVTIRARHRTIQQGHPGLAPGRYAELIVSDDGPGMTADVQDHAFEPFFTTKPSGRGTGLGLSMVYGIARQSKGDATIRSELGKGTEITILLPAAPGVLVQQQPRAPRPASFEGLCVLVVEDQDAVRDLAVRVLERAGCDVTPVATVAEARRQLQAPKRFDLLFSDILLGPGESGADLAREALQLRPDLPILLTTGFAASATDDVHALAVEVLDKPYEPDNLLAAAARVLGRSAASGAEATA